MARGRAMNREYPIPDDRLTGKVKLEQVVVPIRRDALRVASSDGKTIETELLDAKTEISRLAGLGELEYEGERKKVAKLLNFRAPALDHLVAAERDHVDDGNRQGRALSLPEPEPWPE